MPPLHLKNLYENFKLLILRSSELDEKEISIITDILKEFNVPIQIQDINKQITAEEFVKKEFTHIISNTSDFPLYKFIQEKLIPVVTSQFILKINELKRQPSIRPFSPNPEHVLKDVTVCVGGLPDSDKEAIYGAVRALGGSFSDTLNKFVTHLISTDVEEDCCIVVNTIQEPKILIVVPNWIDDCIKLRRKLDVTPYLLVEDKDELNTKLKNASQLVIKEQSQLQPGNILSGKIIYLGSDLQLQQITAIDIVSWIETSAGGKVTKDINKANIFIGKFRDGLEYQTAMKNNILVASLYWVYWMQEHQRFISPYEKLLHHPWVRGGFPEMKDFVISSTNYTGDARQYVTKLVQALGAKFTTTLNKKNTHLIAASTAGKKYESAVKWGTVQIINHLWLEETYADWCLKPTSHPRYSYYPHHFNMNELIGDTPLKVKVLKKFLESGEGELTTIGNLIEDSQDEDPLDLVTSKDILDKARESEKEATPQTEHTTTNDIITNKENVTPPLNTSTLPVESSSLDPKKSSNPPLSPIKPNQEVVIEEIIELANKTSTPSRVRVGRKAKNAASEKLHADMEELNVFEKQVKSHDVPLLPEEIAENKKRIKVEKMTKKLKRARESGTEEDLKANLTAEEKQILEQIENKSVKRPKKESTTSITIDNSSITPEPTTKYNINAICTGWEVSFNKTDTSLLTNLGIHLYKDLKSNINTIAAPRMLRTEKFLISLSHNIQHIIIPEFFKDVVTQYKSDPYNIDSLPSVDKYSLEIKNSSSVKENNSVGLKTLVTRCQSNYLNKIKLFQGLTFNIISKLPGGIDTISKILKNHGVKDIKIFKNLKDLKNLSNLKYTKGKKKGDKNTFIFLSNDKSFDERLIGFLNTDGENYEISGKIVEWGWIVSSIFNMELSKEHITYEY